MNLSIGPTASSKSKLKKKSLYKRLSATDTLLSAWHAIRRNGETSRSAKTREEVKKFGNDLPRQLRRIQDKLRNGYEFQKQFGATPEKKKGKGKRPLVIADPAPIEPSVISSIQCCFALSGPGLQTQRA
jgi:RNA-directed DNA polymerase